jgi:hypothetical protein
LSKCVKKKEVFAKKVSYQVIDDILEEIIQSKESKNSVVIEAKELQEKIAKKSSAESVEESTVFFEDYLEFVTKHQKMKTGIGPEALQILLRELDLEDKLAQAQAKKKYEEIRFIRAFQRAKIQPE